MHHSPPRRVVLLHISYSYRRSWFVRGARSVKFSDIVNQTREWLKREERVSYRALKRGFDLDDEYIEDLKEEWIVAKRVARNENSDISTLSPFLLVA